MSQLKLSLISSVIVICGVKIIHDSILEWVCDATATVICKMRITTFEYFELF